MKKYCSTICIGIIVIIAFGLTVFFVRINKSIFFYCSRLKCIVFLVRQVHILSDLSVLLHVNLRGFSVPKLTSSIETYLDSFMEIVHLDNIF